MKRSFRFVANSADYWTIMDKLQARNDAVEILTAIDRLATSRGNIDVLRTKLQPEGDAGHPRFLRMKFKASLTLPAATPRQR